MLLMVVLVVFGIAALTTALSNARLGQKVADRAESYYAAESAAFERFAAIDKAITNAPPHDAISGLNAMRFDTQIAQVDGGVTITYETWSGDVGIRCVLAMTDGDIGSLHITEWIQTTRDD